MGHVVASIAEGSGDASAEKPAAPASTEASGAPATRKESDVDQSITQQPGNAPSSPVNEAPARHALIRFPPRRTPTGGLISMLPAAKAAAAVSAATGSVVQSESTTTRGHPMKSEPEAPRLFVRQPPRRPGPPSPPRKELTDREIETIMLGGICD